MTPSDGDLDFCVFILGMYIQDKVKKQINDEELAPLKAMYLRLNWWRVKSSMRSPEESRATASLLENSPDCHVLQPDWLLCHKKQSERHFQPCNELSEECHCLRLQQCAAAEIFS